MDACAAEGISTIKLTLCEVLGFQFNWALYGILSLQTFIYYQSGVPHRRLTKTIVYGLFVAETLQTILATHDGWHELVISWGDCGGLLTLNLNWLSLPFMTGIESCVIQCYYARRIYFLGKSKTLVYVIVMLALMQASAAVAEAITALTLNSVPNTQSKTYKITTDEYQADITIKVWLGGTAACDALIACVMIYFVFTGRNSYNSTNSIATKIIRISLQTGLCTSVVSIVQLCLFLTSNHALYYIVPALMLSKIYSNSLLSLLNSRLSITYRRGIEFHSSAEAKQFRREEGSLRRGRTIYNAEDMRDNIAMVTFKPPTGEEDVASNKFYYGGYMLPGFNEDGIA
ncbi:hypothetical protein CERSUDRAFT_74313 [Gelatoporia subvermispora B]|uniref:DUF6534 domain-containing protein n=1 Tax=Ceriporiopsis subvermispora (strain B) TaxID=914234 RepID=M2PJB4_CERS8|nr:hypothetical protein CERSUDRAFT_74313 [Gelatoporia subvermispora B]